MRSLDVFDVKRCDNPDCHWSKYELQADKSEVGDDGFQQVVLISTLRCQCESSVIQKVTEILEFVLPDDELGCLIDCEG